MKTLVRNADGAVPTVCSFILFVVGASLIIGVVIAFALCVRCGFFQSSRLGRPI